MKIIGLGTVALALVIGCAITKANDFGVSGVGGSWHPTGGEHRSIQMVSERIRIDIFQGKDYHRYYDTTADFLFYNQGPAVSVNMAFPEKANGEAALINEKSPSGFRMFQTSVDGQVIKAKRVVAKRKLKSGVEYQALWIKRVSFKKGERKTVKVSFRSAPGNLAGVGWFAAYDFTGGNWFGKVEKSVLTVALHTQTNEPVRAFFAKKPIVTHRNKNMFTYKWTNWQANGPFRFWYGITRGQENTNHALFNYHPENAQTTSNATIAPDKLVRDLYKAHKAGQGPFFQTKNRALVDKYFTKGLADLIWKDAVKARGEVGAIDFDPLYGSQDPQVSNFIIMDTGWGGESKFGPDDKAVVQVTFKDSGRERMVSFQFMQGKDKKWKIYDVHYRGNGDELRLVNILTKAASTS